LHNFTVCVSALVKRYHGLDRYFLFLICIVHYIKIISLLFTARPDTLLDGARRKKKIAAGNILTPDSTDELIEGVDDIPTPDDLDTPDDMEGELEWEGKLADSSLVRKKGPS